MGNSVTLDTNAIVSTSAEAYANNRQASGNDLVARQNVVINCDSIVAAYLQCLRDQAASGADQEICTPITRLCQAGQVNLDQYIMFRATTNLDAEAEIELRQTIENQLTQAAQQRAAIGNRVRQSIRTMSIAAARALARSSQCIFNTVSAEQSFELNGGVVTAVNMNQVIDFSTNVLLHNRAVMQAAQALALTVSQETTATPGSGRLVGIIVGSIIGLIVLCIVIWLIVKYTRRKSGGADEKLVINAQVDEEE